MPTENSGLSFHNLQTANSARVGQFKTPHGALAHPSGTVNDWNSLEWCGAMCGEAGEAGEAANIAKKLRRGDFGKKGSATYAKGVALLAKELADNVIYTDLVAQSEGINLGEEVEMVWNTKSNEIGFTGRLQNGAFVAGADVAIPAVTVVEHPYHVYPPLDQYADELPDPARTDRDYGDDASAPGSLPATGTCYAWKARLPNSKKVGYYICVSSGQILTFWNAVALSDFLKANAYTVAWL